MSKGPPEAATALLRPAADDLFETVELDPKINNSRKDEPDILQPRQKELLL
jgi:putative SOS response-associated peptidase YedK